MGDPGRQEQGGGQRQEPRNQRGERGGEGRDRNERQQRDERTAAADEQTRTAADEQRRNEQALQQTRDAEERQRREQLARQRALEDQQRAATTATITEPTPSIEGPLEAEAIPFPRDTGHPMDRALRNFTEETVTEEIDAPRIQAAAPFAVGAIAEAGRSTMPLLPMYWSSALAVAPLSQKVMEVGTKIAGGQAGYAMGMATEKFAATGLMGAMIAGVLSPTMAFVKRIATG